MSQTPAGLPPLLLRARYEQAVRDLRRQAALMRRDGASAESIARSMHAERRRLAALYKSLTPEPYRSHARAHALRAYGCAEGPSIAFLRAAGKSWEAIIESATRPGPMPGADEPVR